MRRTTRRQHPRMPLILVLLALAALMASACDGGAKADPASTATPVATQAAGALGETRTPRMLPVTPVSIAYRIADPKFEALPGARAIYGEHDGFGYQLELPNDWNGDVVYFAHGFRGNPPELTVTAPPLRAHLIEHGYAWAASSYTKNGYEPGAGARDTFALRDVFREQAGEPRREYLYGQSMGGHVASLSLEQFPDAYDGALSECGVVSGHEILDYFLSWGALSAYLTGIDLYGATTDPGAFGTKLRSDVLPKLGPLDGPTDAGKTFENAVLHLTGGPRPFFQEGFAANYAFNFVILVNAVGAAGPANAASSNVDIEYTLDAGLPLTSAQLNREVERIAANEAFRDRAAYPEFADMTGQIRVPYLTLHGTGDLFVPISLEQSYRATVEAAGNSDLLVQRAVRRAGHCNFTEAERERAFDDLVAWVEGGERPAGDDLRGDLSDAGRDWTQPLEENDPGGVR